MLIEKTPLEAWIREKIAPDSIELSGDQINKYQHDQLIRNIDYVKANSSFYRNLFSDFEANEIADIRDISKIPFTTSEDIKKQGTKLICVPQDEIERIVTLDTSGTTDLPKRIYFTREDQELTIDFFHYGMSTLVRESERVLILLPGIRPGSIGDLLKIGLKRMGVEGIIYGIVDDAEKVEQIILNEEIDAIVGIPQQVFALSNLKNAKKIKEKGRLKNILLSTDFVSNFISKKISESWGCNVYEHYGMTEMGLGGGVFCKALNGYHLREADLLFEIVDTNTGNPVEDGQYGEVVFTTLTRKAMPLIRYRTGDISRFIKKDCPCGTVLKTMEKIQYRIAASVLLSEGYVLTMPELEEILFDIEGVIDFDAVLTLENNIDFLTVYINKIPSVYNIKEKIMSAFEKSELGAYISKGKFKIKIEQQGNKELDIKAIKKRKIVDKRKEQVIE